MQRRRATASARAIMMKQSILVLGAALLCCLTVYAHSDTFVPDECCFHFYDNRLPKNKVEDYRRTSTHCANKGVIVTMQNGKEFCVKPDQQWVRGITNLIDEKKSG